MKQSKSTTLVLLLTAFLTFQAGCSYAESVHAANRCIVPQNLSANPTPISTDALEQPLDIRADSAEGQLKEKQVQLEGNVRIIQGTQSLSADQATYGIDSGDLTTRGNVLLSRNDIDIRADQVNYNVQTKSGEALDAIYHIADIPAQGNAERISLIDAEQSELTGITYTTCQGSDQDWQLHADKLEIDRTEGMGTAQNATLSFMDVPIAYLPWIAFPIDNQRHSGFLLPSIGFGEKNGLDVTTPYYLNLAPHYDLTLLPRIISERGLMLGGEFRFLTENTRGTLHAEYLPKDNKSTDHSKNRGSFSLNTRSRFNQHFSSLVQIEHVTDDDYLDDLGNPLSVSTASLLQRNAELHYKTRDYSLLARMRNYQVLNNGSEPYSILPQIKLDWQTTGDHSGLLYQLDTEIIHFAKDDDAIEGTRFDFYPAMSLPIQDDYYHLTPKIGARHTQYSLDNQTAGLDDSPSRLAGIFSIDGGLYFERDTSYFGAAAQQTLEPRIYYLYTSQHDHDDIPLFDTSLYSFSTASLFRENRFNGADRLGDANQISLSLTTRYNDQTTGREKLKASVGQIFYLQDREVTLSNSDPEQETNSDIAGEFTAYLNDEWQTRGNLVWDMDNQEIDQALAQIHYRYDDDHLFNLSYRSRDELTEQLDISTIWPLTQQTQALAHWRYSLEEKRTQEAILGVEYGSCCWKVRTLLRQHADTKDTEDIAFFVQLELTGLGKLGDNLEDLLSTSIYGYRREN